MLLVGLGNPNPNNNNNRHNVGFSVIDAINQKFKLSKQKPKFKGLLTTGKIGEQNFAQGMQMVHYDILEYLSRPICLLLIIAGLLTLITGVYKALSYSLKS